jgi:hypothetical protein
MDRTLTLHFIDGSKLSLEFPEQTKLASARQMKFADFLASKHLLVEAEGSLLIIPVVNIKYMSVNIPSLPTKGAGNVLPRQTLLGARIRS